MSRISIAVALVVMLLFSCEGGSATNCRECTPGSIGNVSLKIYVRNPEAIPTNPIITLYEGAIEDSIVLRHYSMDDPYALTFYYDAMLYKNYTATVEFYFNGHKYVMIDAACPRVRYDETSCNEPCYYIYDNVIDLRLRYY
jgi:hypothetical protein